MNHHSIRDRIFGITRPTFIVAELSCNHARNLDIAIKSVIAAKECGADAVKFQTFTADTISVAGNSPELKISGNTPWDGTTFHELYAQASMPWEWHAELAQVAAKEGIVWFSSPFDNTAVDFLEKQQVPMYKIASFELQDIQLVQYVASKGKPVILSTGTATLGEIERSVQIVREQGIKDIALLKCTSAYPTPPEDAHLQHIPLLRDTFGVISGLSDHTNGYLAPVVAVSLGARIIEKHFILDRSIPSLDSSFSLDKKEFREMIQAVREAELLLGESQYLLTEKAKAARKFGRSLYTTKSMSAGDIIRGEDVRSARPLVGIPAQHLESVIGKKVKCNLKAHSPLKWENIEGLSGKNDSDQGDNES